MKPKKEYKYFTPFWSKTIKEQSDKLFLPTEENLTNDTKTQRSFNKNKWFKSEFYNSKTKCDKIRCSHQKNSGKIKKVVKIRLFCNSTQKEVIRRFMGVYRYFYNRTITYCKNINKKTNKSFYYVDNKDETTKKIVELPKNYYDWYKLGKLLMENQPKWLKDVGLNNHSCRLAIKEALIGIKTNIKKGEKFNMKLKTKKDLIQTILLEKSVFQEKWKTLFAKYKLDDKYVFRNLQMSDNIWKYDFCDSNLSYHKVLNTITLNLTYNDNIKQTKKTKVGALDQGERNFMTLYSDDSVCKLGINCEEKILKVCKEMDIICSRIDNKYYYKNHEKVNVHANRKRNLRKAFHRKIRYVKNLINELHNQIINYLVSHYGKIIISPFETQEMVTKLVSKVARMMNTLQFYKFRTKLQSKCDEYGCNLVVKEESFTTKTCTRCGNIKNNVGGAKVYRCDNCKLVIDRDYGGARNIMLKNNS